VKDDVIALVDHAFEHSAPRFCNDAPPGVMPPVYDDRAMTDVVNAMISMHSEFVWPIGDENRNPDWAWSVALTVAGGLGRVYGQRLLQAAAMDYDSEELSAFYTLDDAAWSTAVVDARKVCGYPVALLRVDWHKLQLAITRDAWVNEDGTARYIRWLRAVILAHFLRHTRLAYDSTSGEPVIIAAYRGAYLRRTMLSDSLEAPWTSKVNNGVFADVARTLELPVGRARGDWLSAMVISVFAQLRPSQVVRVRSVHERFDIAVGPAVRTRRLPRTSTHYSWIDTGISITNVVRIDTETGDLDVHGGLSGPDTIALDWPVADVKNEVLANWLATLPDKAVPALPSEFLRKYIRNWNPLGQRAGGEALCDALIIADLYRSQLAGTRIGATLQKEYPPVFALPTGHTEETTTNQGKTTLVALLGKAMEPNLPVTGFIMSTSPPAQRSLAEPIHRFGSCVYDEFIMPLANEHFLNKQGIQTLATGASFGPGRAGENAMSPTLKHPLFFSAKVAAVPPDIHNRMVALFLDKLDDTNRCSGDEYDAIGSGAISVHMRMCLNLWVAKTGFLDKLRTAKTVGSDVWRFPGHATIAAMLSSVEDVKAYLDASIKACNEQLARADESGLLAELNTQATFDPGYYLGNMSVMTLGSLAQLSKIGPRNELGYVSALDLLTYVVEDGDRRNLKAELARARGGLQEKSAAAKMVAYLKNLPESKFVKDGFELIVIPSELSGYRDSWGHAKPGIRVSKIETAKPSQAPSAPAPPAPPKG
jgi:hypothetical protein